MLFICTGLVVSFFSSHAPVSLVCARAFIGSAPSPKSVQLPVLRRSGAAATATAMPAAHRRRYRAASKAPPLTSRCKHRAATRRCRRSRAIS